MRGVVAAAIVGVVGVLVALFVVWWNYRLWKWFVEGGLAPTLATSLVWGPFLLVGLWVLWLCRNSLLRR